MSTYIDVNCNNCDKSFPKTLKRYNEYKKNSWKWYCSKKCQVASKLTGKTLMCGNPKCDKTFYRKRADINPAGDNFCSQSCSATANNASTVRIRKLRSNRVRRMYENSFISKKEIMTEGGAI